MKNNLNNNNQDIKDFILEKINAWLPNKDILEIIRKENMTIENINMKRFIENLKSRNKNKEEPQKDDINEIINELFEDLRLKWITWNNAISAIRKTIKEKHNEILQNAEIIEMLKKYVSQKNKNEEINNSIDELNENIDEIKKYSVNDWKYIFYIKKVNKYWENDFEEIKIPVELVDWLFYDFSKFWKNMSWTEILKKYRLKPEVFQALKSRLGLYKASNTISPRTLENSSDEEIEKSIDSAIYTNINDKYKDKFVKSYDKVFETEAKKAFKVAWNVEHVIELIRDWISKMEPLKVDRKAINKMDYNSDIAIFLSSDYHFWESDDDILELRIDEVIKEMINTKEHYINWLSLWDLAETFLEEWMHPWQTNRMRKQWFELVQHIYKVFASKMVKVIENWKHLTVDRQGWNHDRMWKTNDMDRCRTWALVIWEMIELSLKNYIDQWLLIFNNYKWPTIRKMVWQLWIIANHGDWMWAKMTNAAILSKYWFWWDVYHIILEWDKHHFIANQDTNSMRVVTSSVKWGWQYSEEVIYKDSVPWYVKITETEKWKAKIILNMFDN